MTHRPECSKLRELRAKTDRDLATLVNNQIDSALHYQRLGLAAKAQHASREASTLLRLVDAADRRRLECKLRTVADAPRVRAACP